MRAHFRRAAVARAELSIIVALCLLIVTVQPVLPEESDPIFPLENSRGRGEKER